MPAVVAADGTRIFYDCFGRPDGEPLVLIMGLAVDRWGWIRQRAGLAERFRCISLDNRGVGLSDKPTGPYDLFTMADDIVAVLDAEGIDSAHVMGYSLGGVLAQILTVRSPTRVRSLVLASTACRLMDWRREVLHEWSEMVRVRGVRAFANENLRWVAPARHLRWIAPIAPTLAPLLVRAPRHGIIGPEYFADAIRELEPMHEAGAIEIRPQGIEVLPGGRLLVRAVAMAFDRYLRHSPAAGTYSKIA